MDTYQQITNKIVAMIEAGADREEWRMPWHSKAGEAALVLPRNPISGTRYRGINVPILWAAAEARGYAAQQWATYKQWAEKGAQVRKGERSELVFFWKRLEGPAGAGDAVEGEDAGEDRKRLRFVARAYNVFAAEQVDGYTPKEAGAAEGAADSLDEAARIAAAEEFFAGLGATLRHGGNRAFYSPSADFIQMPEFGQFEEAGAYYATLGHEHIHWTGAKKRLGREFGARFGDEAYAFEELVAELGAAFLCADLGLPMSRGAIMRGIWRAGCGCCGAIRARSLPPAARRKRRPIGCMPPRRRSSPLPPEPCNLIPPAARTKGGRFFYARIPRCERMSPAFYCAAAGYLRVAYQSASGAAMAPRFDCAGGVKGLIGRGLAEARHGAPAGNPCAR